MSEDEGPMGNADEEARTVELAAYIPNQFVISGGASGLIDADGEVIPSEFAVLMHEYVHYWHNISTVTGCIGTVSEQSRLSVLSMLVQLDADERLAVSPAKLTDELERESEFQLEYAYYVGASFRLPEAADDDFTIEEVVRETETLQFRGTALPVPIVWLDLESEGWSGSVLFGGHVIEESLAYLFESNVAAVFELELDPADRFPYHMLELVWEACGCDTVPARTLAYLGTLALLSQFPGDRFVGYAQGFSGQESEQIVETTEQLVRGFDVSRFDEVVAELTGLLEIHAAREPSRMGMEFLVAASTTAFERRQANVCFDVDVFFDVDKAELGELLRTFPPADIMTGAALFRAGEPIEQFGDQDGLRVFQSMVHIMEAHSDGGSFGDAPEPSTCPFYAHCTVETKDAAVCCREPWKKYRRNADACLFGLGVACLLGDVWLAGRATP